jgi:hypothetical protein
MPELTISVPGADERLLVRYDLLAIPSDPDEIVLIVDYKTSARPRPRDALRADMQTRLYPFVLVAGGSAVAGRELDPANVELVFWQAAEPAHPVHFPYSAAQHEANRQEIRTLTDRARALQKASIPPVIDDLSICARCPYRTYCNQPIPATTAEAEPDPLELSAADDDIPLEELD